MLAKFVKDIEMLIIDYASSLFYIYEIISDKKSYWNVGIISCKYNDNKLPIVKVETDSDISERSNVKQLLNEKSLKDTTIYWCPDYGKYEPPYKITITTMFYPIHILNIFQSHHLQNKIVIKFYINDMISMPAYELGEFKINLENKSQQSMETIDLLSRYNELGIRF